MPSSTSAPGGNAPRSGRGGWAITVPILALLAISAAGAAWTGAGITLPMFDTAVERDWHPMDEDTLFWLFPVLVITAAVLTGILMYAGTWTRSLPLLSPIGSETWAWGAAVGFGGAAAQILSVHGAGLAAAVAVAAALAVAGLAVRRTRTTREGVRAEQVRQAEVAELRERGTRVRAEVREVVFRSTWLGGNLPVFSVTAAFETPSGPRTATDTLVTAPADAPIAGGTVYVRYLDDEPGEERMRTLFEVDPDSPKDPDAADTYDAGSPS